MWKTILKSSLFWDAIIVLGIVIFFGQPILGVLAELAMFYVWMAVIAVAVGGLLLWGCVRAMNPKRKKEDQPTE